ncbi:major facilitator superfamily domain-containing protein 9 [Rhinophrynus dorsalis]
MVGFLDLFGVSMIVPLLNHHIKSLGASTTTAGIIGSSYGILQLFSSSIVGSWSDIVGRRFSLITCILASSFGYALLGASSNIFICAISRIPVGMFKHSLSISKALLSDLVSEKERAVAMGRFNAASSIGFILGPIVGGYLTERGGFYLNCFLCSAIFIVNAGLVWIMPQMDDKLRSSAPVSNESTLSKKNINLHTPESGVKLEISQEENGILKSRPTQSLGNQVLSVLQKVTGVAFSSLWDIFLVRLLMAIAVLLCYSNFALAMEERFHMTPLITGYLISYSSSLGVVAGFLIGPLSRIYKHSSYTMVLHSSTLTFACLLLYSIAPSIWFVVLAFTFLAFSTNISRTCIVDVELTIGKKYGSGTLIGIGQSVSSVGRILAPLFSGIAQEFSPSGPPQLGAALALASIFLMHKMKSRYTGTTAKEKNE